MTTPGALSVNPKNHLFALLAMAAALAAAPASAQSFRVQCPSSTNLHPAGKLFCGGNPTGTSCATATDCSSGLACIAPSGQIKCQEVAGGDGYATMGDGTQIYLFGFGPLSGLNSLTQGLPGTQTADIFNVDYTGPNYSTAALAGVCTGGTNSANFNQACVALTDCPDPTGACTYSANADLGVCIGGNNPVLSSSSSTPAQSCTAVSDCRQYAGATACQHLPNWAANRSDGAVKEPAGIIDMGVLSSNAPAPLMAIDEDDEFFLTLSNAGMVMRPDLFEQHTIHFHGYPNASSFFDGVPDASVAINIAGSFTYYYTAPDAGSYFWHCHIAPPEHLQMGMVGQLYVRPRQNRVAPGADLKTALVAANLAAARPVAGLTDNFDGTKGCSDILCTGQTPAPATSALRNSTGLYAYNDGNGVSYYDREYPVQMMGFDPNFHYVGMTFNPEDFADMKDKYFLLSGRGYPDTVGGQVDPTTKAVVPGPLLTQGSDGVSRPSQPLPSLIKIDKTHGETRALLRISMLSVTEHVTLATVGVPMTVVGYNARLLRDMSGNDLSYKSNSITLGGGESADIIIDVSDSKYQPGQTFFLYSTNLDHLSNDAENFGGMMTEIVIL